MEYLIRIHQVVTQSQFDELQKIGLLPFKSVKTEQISIEDIDRLIKDVINENLEVEDGKYPQYITLQATGDKTSLLDGYKVGEEVEASFNLRGREWQDKHFNSLLNTGPLFAFGSSNIPNAASTKSIDTTEVTSLAPTTFQDN